MLGRERQCTDGILGDGERGDGARRGFARLRGRGEGPHPGGLPEHDRGQRGRAHRRDRRGRGGVGGEDERAARVPDDREPPARGQALVGEQGHYVEQLPETVDGDDPGLPEKGADPHSRAGRGCRMGGGGACPGR